MPNIQPDKPNQNAFIERFSRTYRTEVLDVHLFANLGQAQAITHRCWSITTSTAHTNRWVVRFMPRLTLVPIVFNQCLRQGCLRPVFLLFGVVGPRSPVGPVATVFSELIARDGQEPTDVAVKEKSVG
ncbi:integrase core domain-containing protein [Achromobacter xylosoxidans]|uniref:integrase core domain-containing protein n=1 Tax=Alcaligenes xylosoxydans xylosoxydans TaxID=85698 RepID=UPI003BA9687A